MNKIEKITEKQLNPSIPEFRVGDTVRVGVRIIEGKKERVQAFEGVVISRKGKGVSETFTVRKMSAGIGVERIFPVNSPKIAKLTVVRKGKARRAKLTFLRGRVASYRLKERANKNGVEVQILNKDETLKLEPNLSEEVVASLYAPTAGILDPFTMVANTVENFIINCFIFILI